MVLSNSTGLWCWHDIVVSFLPPQLSSSCLNSVSKDSNLSTRPPPTSGPPLFLQVGRWSAQPFKFCNNITKTPPGMLKAAVHGHPILTLSCVVWSQKLTALPMRAVCSLLAPAPHTILIVPFLPFAKVHLRAEGQCLLPVGLSFTARQ